MLYNQQYIMYRIHNSRCSSLLIMNILTQILDFLFPDTCHGCGTEGAILCKKCIHTIPRKNNAEYEFINPLFVYQSPLIKDLIWCLKYKNAKRIAAFFGKELHAKLIDITSEEISFSKHEKILLVPIPLHSRRLRERGYNQSELLAYALKKYDVSNLCIIAPHALTRTRDTKIQARAEKRGVRFKNLANAFTCRDSSLVRGRYVILIDDVTTTGATLVEAKRALEKSGARKVLALTLAH